MKLPQYYKGRHFGALLDTYQRSAGMLSAVQYIAMLIVLYTTSIQPFVIQHLPWLTFNIYMIIVFVSIAIMMVSVYIVGTPSSFAFWSEQIWKHDNPMRHKLEAMEKRQLEIDRKLNIVLKHLGIEDVK